MKLFLSLLLLSAGINCAAQVSIFTQPLPLQHHSNDSFSISIKNRDTVSHAFYPLTVFDQPNDYYFVNNQSVYERLRSKGSQIGAIHEMLRLIKSPAFKNFWMESMDDGPTGFLRELAEKRYAVNGFILGSAAYNCSHFAYFIARTLVDAGIFKSDSVRIVYTGNHQLVEFNMNGKWVGIDADPGEPYAISSFPGGTLMSFEEARQHPENLKKYVWHGTTTDSVVFYSERNTASYLSKLKNLYYRPLPEAKPANISGIWKLCAGSELIWSYKIPQLIDTTIEKDKQMFNSIFSAAMQNNYAKAAELAAEWLNMTNGQQALGSLIQGKVMLTNGTIPYLLRNRSYTDNELILKVRTTDQPIVLGKDLALPMTIKSITTTRPVAIGDTVFPAGYSRIVRYNKKDFIDFTNSDEAPLQTSKQFQYLSSGTIPSNTDVEFHLYYNQLIYPFPYGLQVESFGDDISKLTVITYPEPK